MRIQWLGWCVTMIALTAGNIVRADQSAMENRPTPESPIIGTLDSDPARNTATNEAGSRAVVVGLGWDRTEPREGEFDSTYLQSVAQKIAAFRAGGKLVVLDFGVQYPPRWIFAKASSHFVNQYGVPFTGTGESGECGVNLVFSQEMRDKFEEYVKKVFAELGIDFYGVRLGGGRYGELGYPTNDYASHTNCYWAFDPLAQGKQPGLARGLKTCPVPGWTPGTVSPGHDFSRQFLDWYMASMQNYHDWQIALVRRSFPGWLFMLYPSIGGLRPGQLEAAINDDANGKTGPEKTGEVGRGYDTARFVAGITDPKVVVYSTWVDGFEGSDDSTSDPRRWSPGYFVSSLAFAHRPPLLAGGENTGHPDDRANLEETFRKMRAARLSFFFWAFEPTLFDHQDRHATLEDFQHSVRK